MVYKFFDKISSGSGVDAEPTYQLANELHKQIIRKFSRQKVYLSFRDNILNVDLLDIQSLNKCESSIYCVQSICLVKIHGLFLWKTKEELVSLMHFKK